jgi:methylphosphotriester-DNA--protein-cysteine methyltransferase
MKLATDFKSHEGGITWSYETIQASIYAPSGRQGIASAGYISTCPATIFIPCLISETGMSPIQYLKSLRMERARFLLQTSSLSFRDITPGVGLKDDSHFAPDFKKTYGKPPIVYRTRSISSYPRRSTESFSKAATSANKQQKTPTKVR